jgi:hypothetical protein
VKLVILNIVGRLFIPVLLASIISLILGASSVSAEQWNIEDESFKTPAGYHHVIVDQATEYSPQTFSWMSAHIGTSYQKPRYCLELNPCSTLTLRNGYSFEGNLVLGNCVRASQQYCLESVDITDALAIGPARFVRYVVPDLPHPGSWGSFNGSDFKSSSIWEVPHEGGVVEHYLVTAAVQFMASAIDEKTYPQISARVERFSYLVDPLETPIAEVTSDGLSLFNKRESGIGIGFASWRKCAWSESKLCGLREDFERPATIRVALRVPKHQVIPYLSSTIKNAEMSYADLSDSTVLITVAGQSDWIPTIFVRIKDSEFPASLADHPVNLNLGRWGVKSNYAPINAIRPIVEDRATGKKAVWGFQTLGKYAPSTEPGVEFWLSKKMRVCAEGAPGLIGSTSTNAMAYGQGPPVFDGKELKASVAGMHFDTEGEIERGRFDIRLNRSFAACLFGFRDAPTTVTVSITGDNGEPKVAFTTLKQKGEYIYLQASGFTFSTTHITLRLSQSKVTIVCRSGARFSKISGTNPKCPKGFHRSS